MFIFVLHVIYNWIYNICFEEFIAESFGESSLRGNLIFIRIELILMEVYYFIVIIIYIVITYKPLLKYNGNSSISR